MSAVYAAYLRCLIMNRDIFALYEHAHLKPRDDPNYIGINMLKAKFNDLWAERRKVLAKIEASKFAKEFNAEFGEGEKQFLARLARLYGWAPAP